jgi:BlaI family penicillinase repressor
VNLKKPISKAEFVVMECIWNQPSLVPKPLSSLIGDDIAWHKNTIRTLLLRLVTKGYVSRRKDGRSFRYSAIISRDEYVNCCLTKCIEDLFKGSAIALLSTVTSQSFLCENDIDHLSALLAKKKRLKGAWYT